MRVQLAERRTRELAAHRERAGRLRERWSSIQQGKRVLIHLPSLGNVLFIVTATIYSNTCYSMMSYRTPIEYASD